MPDRRPSRTAVRPYLAAASGLLAVLIAAGPAAAVNGWAGPNRVSDGRYHDVSLAVDSAGKLHVAATGNSGIWYLTNRSGPFVRTRLSTNPADYKDRHPSLAVDGNDDVYVAWERFCAGCTPGDTDGILYVTDKGRPNGSFPATPTVLAGDGAIDPSLKIVDGDIHLAYAIGAFAPKVFEAPVLFKTNASGSWTTRRVADWGSDPSLRVGSDGLARISFTGPEHASSKRFSVILAQANTIVGQFELDFLPGASYGGRRSSLALDALDRPHVAFDRPAGGPNGSYYFKRVGGSWTGGRFTTRIGVNSLAVNDSGRPHIGLAGAATGVYWYRRVNGTLTGQTLSNNAEADGISLRIGGNGKPVIAYVTEDGVPDGLYIARKQ